MITSQEYEEFLQEIKTANKKNLYERACARAQVISIKPWKSLEKKYTESINFSHLKITPTGAFSLAILISMFVLIVPSLIALPFLIAYSPSDDIADSTRSPIQRQSQSADYFGDFMKVLMITGTFAGMIFYYLFDYPIHHAVTFRIKASAEMVLAIIYMTISMRISPNVESAVKFASKNLTGPLAFDMRQMIWDVYTRKYESITAALDQFMEKWKNENEEFAEAIFLIKTSSSEMGRFDRNLDEAVSVMLQGTKDRMKKYSQGLRTPVTSLNAMGILLPVIGLIFFPIISIFLPDLIQPIFLVLGYDVLLPFVVYVMMKSYLDKRPYTLHQPDLSKHPRFVKEKILLSRPFVVAASIMVVLVSIGMYGIAITGPSILEGEVSAGRLTTLLGYSMLITIGLSTSICSYLYLSTKNKMKIRNEVAQIEDEFAEVLFQLGSQLRRGVPIEATLRNTMPKMRSFMVARFFDKILYNIETFGMTLEQAVFDKDHGAIKQYPSKVIETVMRAITEISKKGMDSVSKSMVTISGYLKDVKSVENDLQDMMSETTSTMQIQSNLLAPMSTGIVVAITAIVFQMLLILKSSIEGIKSQLGASGSIGLAGESIFGGLIELNQIIPVHQFQILVGVYMIEIITMLGLFMSIIQNGDENILRRQMIAKTLFRGTLMYAGIAMIFYTGFSSLIPISGIG